MPVGEADPVRGLAVRAAHLDDLALPFPHANDAAVDVQLISYLRSHVHHLRDAKTSRARVAEQGLSHPSKDGHSMLASQLKCGTSGTYRNQGTTPVRCSATIPSHTDSSVNSGPITISSTLPPVR